MGLRLLSGLLVGAALMLGCATCSRSGDGTGASPLVPAASGANYQIAVRAPERSKVGVEATTEVIVTPQGGFHINLEYPAKLQLSAVPEGVAAPQLVGKAQMTAQESRLLVPVRFTGQAPGSKRFEGELRFSVCNQQSCLMPRENVSWTTEIEAP